MRRVPGRQGAGRSSVGAHPVGMPNLGCDARGGRRPIGARQPGGYVPSAFDPVRISCCDRRRGARPLPVDALTALIHKHIGVTRARMEFGHVVGDVHAVGVEPRTRANPVARVGRLITVRRVALDAQVRAPCAIALSSRRRPAGMSASAPANPPRFPVTLVALVTKKLNDEPDGPVGMSSSPQLTPRRITIESR